MRNFLSVLALLLVAAMATAATIGKVPSAGNPTVYPRWSTYAAPPLSAYVGECLQWDLKGNSGSDDDPNTCAGTRAINQTWRLPPGTWKLKQVCHQHNGAVTGWVSGDTVTIEMHPDDRYGTGIGAAFHTMVLTAVADGAVAHDVICTDFDMLLVANGLLVELESYVDPGANNNTEIRVWAVVERTAP